MRMERVQIMPDWPARMTAELASAYMGISKSSFIARYQPIGVKEGANMLWARAQLDALIAKQFNLKQSPTGRGAEIDTWADL